MSVRTARSETRRRDTDQQDEKRWENTLRDGKRKRYRGVDHPETEENLPKRL